MNFYVNLKHKRTRLITGILFSFWMVPFTVYGGLQISSELCSVCHMMNPEYYTWQVSSHGKAKVKCLSCHIPPGPINFVKYNVLGLKNVYSAAVDNYVAPIKMIRPTPDSACEKCHELNKLDKSSKQKITAAHQKHKNEGVHCAKCHRGVAHGLIADRGITYASDYKKWDTEKALSVMKEQSFTSLDMDGCIDCHKLRGASRECKTCHPGGNMRADHKKKDFKNKTHGILAAKDIKVCNICHQYMNEDPIEGFGESKAFEQYLEQGKTKPVVTPEYYARANKYCKDCHGKRPPGHDEKFIESHGILAKKNEKGCFTCHDNQVGQGLGMARVNTKNTMYGSSRETSPALAQPPPSSINKPVTGVTCSQCHPSPHSQSVQWSKGYHPTKLGPKPKITKDCFTCHSETSCSKCHGGV